MSASTPGSAARGPAQEPQSPCRAEPTGGGQQDRFAAQPEPSPQGPPIVAPADPRDGGTAAESRA
eukprot:8888232-Alexandrium_andersonii.AAC.1